MLIIILWPLKARWETRIEVSFVNQLAINLVIAVASLAPTTTALPVQEEEGTEGELAIVIHVDNPAETPEPEPTPKKKKSKRMRTAFSLVQLDKLELAYHANPYPDGFFRQKVSQETGIPEDRIQVCGVCM